ncbi:hypothetical protein RRG08_033301 [Elysia crispata]|uniref:Uncharacterized protein n=1 Tax=Elysia crispata TaxID=231223 RepID=A0AAE0XSJ3_9GAST|nr:hypothetical protein RRG08_033301 [Elysia crispata]
MEVLLEEEESKGPLNRSSQSSCLAQIGHQKSPCFLISFILLIRIHDLALYHSQTMRSVWSVARVSNQMTSGISKTVFRIHKNVVLMFCSRCRSTALCLGSAEIHRDQSDRNRSLCQDLGHESDSGWSTVHSLVVRLFLIGSIRGAA